MNKYQILKKCNSKKQCIRYCPKCLNINYRHVYCNVEKLIYARGDGDINMNPEDLNCEGEIYSKNYLETHNLYNLLCQKNGICII